MKESTLSTTGLCQVFLGVKMDCSGAYFPLRMGAR